MVLNGDRGPRSGNKDKGKEIALLFPVLDLPGSAVMLQKSVDVVP